MSKAFFLNGYYDINYLAIEVDGEVLTEESLLAHGLLSALFNTKKCYASTCFNSLLLGDDVPSNDIELAMFCEQALDLIVIGCFYGFKEVETNTFVVIKIDASSDHVRLDLSEHAKKSLN